MLSAVGGVVWVMEVLIGVIRMKKEFIVLIIITVILFVSGLRRVTLALVMRRQIRIQKEFIVLFVSALRRVTLALVMRRQVLIIIGNTCVYARDQRLAWNTST
jgi:hypothetical protein